VPKKVRRLLKAERDPFRQGPPFANLVQRIGLCLPNVRIDELEGAASLTLCETSEGSSGNAGRARLEEGDGVHGRQ
jgi:hypothetical protein